MSCHNAIKKAAGRIPLAEIQDLFCYSSLLGGDCMDSDTMVAPSFTISSCLLHMEEDIEIEEEFLTMDTFIKGFLAFMTAWTVFMDNGGSAIQKAALFVPSQKKV